MERQSPLRKRFGQHFLHDTRVLDVIVQALGPIAGKTVVEIGPGRGALTARLIAAGARVVAIEIDRDLAARLRIEYAHTPALELLEADVLRVPLGAAAGGPYVLAGNVPYYITTPILFHALEDPRPSVAVYLVQREVAERMAATPGGKIYGALTVNLQAYADVTVLRNVAARSFTPPPTVESAVVRVVPRATSLVEEKNAALFRTFVIAAFGLRRKQMGRVMRTLTTLSAEDSVSLLTRCEIIPTARPETLCPADFARLTETMAELKVALRGT